MRFILTADHEIPSRPPLIVSPGDIVTVGERDTQWPSFVFVSGDAGSGWVPARHIAADGTTGTVLTAYDTTELPAASGDSVELVQDDPESGWAWCRDANGREGWVPHRVLQIAH